MDRRALRHTCLLAVMWCVVAMTVLISSTYAWFTLRAVAEITPMRGSIGTSDGTLLISNSADGPFDVTCELFPDGAFTGLKPISTRDLNHFYRLDFYDGVKQSYRYRDGADRVATDVLHGYLYLRCEDKNFDVYFDPEQLRVAADEQTLAALRIGMVVNSRRGRHALIFKTDSFGGNGELKTVLNFPQNDSVVSAVSADGQAQYAADTAVNFEDYMIGIGQENGNYLPGRQKVCSIEKDETAVIEYFVYLEGCDIHCLNELQGSQVEVGFGFAGIPLSESENGEEEIE